MYAEPQASLDVLVDSYSIPTVRVMREAEIPPVGVARARAVRKIASFRPTCAAHVSPCQNNPSLQQ